MAELIEIPLINDEASFKMQTILEGVTVFLKFDWVSRIERWTISIYDVNENPLLVGIPLHVNIELISRFKIVGLPPGQLVLFDTTLQNKECAFEELGDRCKLLYQTSV